LTLIVALVLGITVLLWRASPYVIYVANLSLIFALLAVGLNLLIGYCGQVSVGHAAFFGIGAYVSAILAVDYLLPFWISLLAVVLFSGVTGLLLGLPALRLRGHYLILVTLGFGEIVRIILQNWQQVSKGPTGISNIPAIHILGIALDD